MLAISAPPRAHNVKFFTPSVITVTLRICDAACIVLHDGHRCASRMIVFDVARLLMKHREKSPLKLMSDNIFLDDGKGIAAFD